MTISVLIADDHKMFVQALRQLFQSAPDMTVIGDTDNGDELLRMADTSDVRVALVDVSMPGPGIHAILQHLSDRSPAIKTIALTMHFEPSFAEGLIAQGLAGYVIKESAFEELLTAIREVASGKTYMSAELQTGNANPDTKTLTQRELECLGLASEGLANKEIGQSLGISERTVKYHFENTFRKLGAMRRGQAVAAARKRGLFR